LQFHKFGSHYKTHVHCPCNFILRWSVDKLPIYSALCR